MVSLIPEDSHIDFASPRPMETCIRHLELLTHGGFLDLTRAYTRIVNENHAHFEIRRWYALNFMAEVSGHLTSQDEHTTLVYARASFNKRLFVFSILWLPLALGMLLLLMRDSDYPALLLLFLFGAILVVIINVRRLFKERDRLVSWLEESLR